MTNVNKIAQGRQNRVCSRFFSHNLLLQLKNDCHQPRIQYLNQVIRMFMHAGLTEKQILLNTIAFLSQTQLLTHFESVSVALLHTETYCLRIQTILEMT